MPDIELARIGFGVGDKFLEVVGGKIFADHEQFGIFGGQSNRLEILLRIVAQIGIERRRQRIGAEVTGQDRVAVGGGAGGAKRANGAAGAADILHHEFLAEMTREDVSDNPPGDIGGPAGRERNDDRDRSRGIILGLCAIQSRQHQKNSRRHQMLCHLSPPQLHYCSCSRDHRPVSPAGKLGWRRRRHEGAVCSLCFDNVASGAPYQSTQQLRLLLAGGTSSAGFSAKKPAG